ncbi:MAG TPA: hypothetical protein VJV58_09920 [Bradyrhizobium sp.]|uniref:hypothetical protein n=1 Tax=Bradyrhizobium sp. TaxID=376 RepID=UPI002B4834FB|nr:hypothetical protein [Bradyrhizobium sp.]HKO71236.1 hypothetical protein [Bradyrhizobium sp.]
MTIFLILAPYGAFAILMVLSSAAVSLFVSAAICLAVIVYDAIGGCSLKLLGAGSAFLFVALGLYIILIDSSLSSTQVKLTVDMGMLAISVGSLIMRRPFTLQYAREAVDAETARRPEFVKANYVISAAWALAFVLMVAANVLLIYIPGLPLWSGIAIAFAARNSALVFTRWYPEYRRAKLPTTVQIQ